MTPPRDWPKGVAPVSVEQLERLGINERNELFWDGQLVTTRRLLSLTVPQKVLAFLAALASLATVATGLNNASVYLCGRNLHWLGCPVPACPSAAAPVR